MHLAPRLLASAALLLTLAWVGPARAATVSFQTDDGVAISAHETGTGAKAIVLVHSKGRTSQDWSAFTQKLVEKGYRVLAVDLRGHGDSKLEAAITDADYPRMVDDVSAAILWLKANGATSIALVGAEFGANVAANAAARDPDVENLVLLSAGLNVKGVTTGGAIDTYGERPLLIVASEDDAYPHKSAVALEAKAKGLKHYEMLSDAGSGTRMLVRDPDVEALIFSWLDGSYHQPKGAAGAAGEKKAVQTGDTSGIETTGTKFGEK